MMDFMESVENTPQNGHQTPPDDTPSEPEKKRTRYSRKPKEHIVLEDLHMIPFRYEHTA